MVALVTGEVDTRFDEVLQIVEPVSSRFRDAGFELYLVGGVVRDLVLGSHGALDDIDMTTEARPEQIKQLLEGVASTLWTQGERFGTIGARVSGRDLEITTHRAESYESDSRKPSVVFGDDLRVDLSRRDFSLNAMAFSTVSRRLFDPFGGMRDLEQRLLRTPDNPEISFVDDPLRMLRAARFIPRFDLVVDPSLLAAARSLASRLDIVSAERIHDEWEKLLGGADPALGFEFLAEAGLLERIVPGSSTVLGSGERRMAACVQAAASVRRAAMVWHLSPDELSQWLKRLRYSTADQISTLGLVEGARHVLCHDPSDAVVRRLVSRVGLTQVGEVFSLVGSLIASGAAESTVDLVSDDQDSRLVDFTELFLGLDRAEDLSDLGSPLSGGDLIAKLGLTPGPIVGELVSRLAERRVELGPFGSDEALAVARGWLDKAHN